MKLLSAFLKGAANNSLILRSNQGVDLTLQAKSGCKDCEAFVAVLKDSENPFKVVESEEHHVLHMESSNMSERLLEAEDARALSSSRRQCRNWWSIPHPPKPLPHQARLKGISAKYVWLDWSMGSGKTLAALQLAFSESNDLVIVCPNTLIEHWGDVVTRRTRIPENSTCVVRILGYAELHRILYSAPEYLKGSILVVDEAHHYRNMSQPMSYDVACFHKAKRVIYCTGTPIVNDYEVEAKSILKMINVEAQGGLTPESFKDAMTRAECFVSSYNPRTDPSSSHLYPDIKEYTVQVPMTWLDALQYVMTERKHVCMGPVEISTAATNTYGVSTRVACNTSAKFERIIDQIFKTDGRQVVYSHFLESGVLPILELLKSRGKRAEKITGDTPTEQRDSIVQRYNEGAIDVLLLSDASKEGVDLKNSVALHIVEPHVNSQSESQTKGRVARYKSHEGAFTVLVYHYITTFPSKVHSNDVQALQERFSSHWLKEKVDFSVCQALFENLTRLENTEDQKLRLSNYEKQQKIFPYLHAFRN